jgi:Zn-dependent M16 (insulinase) family peptidase
VSDTNEAFTLVQERRIDELDTRARLFRHAKTGAQVLSMENGDENKVFGITFFTPPPDSSGVAHIMEHSVLCGSRKYPAKEPFVELAKGSLRTFLNAFTFPDKTCYPVASQNVRDFYNLIDVYLDAVFYPRLTPYTLQQEGWHYELETPDAPLSYKGVVFNEMRGNYSSPDSLIARFSQESLFPDTLYGVDSGGDPAVIPTLTWENFKRFHEAYYHPSNAFIYFYGDDDPAERLRYLSPWLDAFEAAPVSQRIAAQPAFDAPRRHAYPYDPGQEAERATGFVAVNWRLVPNDDPERTLGLAILSHALVATPASPLRKALLDSGLGEGLIGHGLDTQYQTATFMTGLKGVAAGSAQRVEALIFETLRRLAAEGIDQATTEASLNTIEFELREQNTGGFPRGLAQMLEALTTWLYGSGPLAPLAFEAPLNAIKGRLARGEHYLEGLIQTYFLDTAQHTTVELVPEPGLAARQAETEAAQMVQIKSTLGEADMRALVEGTAELKRRQATPDSPEVLVTIPSLRLEDLDRTSKTIPSEVIAHPDATILFHDLFTNGIAYADVGLNLHALPAELLPYAGLLRKALLTMGTQREDYVSLAQRIGRVTGGIGVSPYLSMTRQAAAPASAWLFVRGKATVDHVGDLFAIVRDVLTALKLDDRERFRQILLEEKAGIEGRLVPQGHGFALGRLLAAYDEADWAEEQLGGVTYLQFLQRCAERLDDEWEALRETLARTWSTLVNRQAMLVNVTVDAARWAAGVRPAVEEFLSALPGGAPQMTAWSPRYPGTSEGLAIPAQVNFVAKGGNLYQAGYKLDGSHMAITNWLRTAYLWERVRVQGGAYGGFCSFDPYTGLFAYLSYRDPNLGQTVAIYDDAPGALRALDLSREEITRSIIGAIGSLDTYQLPDAKGFTALARYLVSETDEHRQQLRDELLGTELSDFHTFGEALESLRDQGRVVVLGSAEALARANAERPDWLRITALKR